MMKSVTIVSAPPGTPIPLSKFKHLSRVGTQKLTGTALTAVADRQSPRPPNDTPLYLQPVLLAALLALIGSMIVLWMNNRFHRERLGFEEKLAERKHDYDVTLAERKFSHSVSMAKWQKQSEFAEEQLALIYEARARLGAIRSPGSYSSENEDRPGRGDETEPVRRARDSYYPVLRRINQASEFFNDFYAARYRAVALFGTGADKPFIRIWQALVRVQVASSMLMREVLQGEHPNVLANRERMEERIWEGAAEEDAVLLDIEKAVEEAEALFRPIIVNAPVLDAGPDGPRATAS